MPSAAIRPAFGGWRLSAAFTTARSVASPNSRSTRRKHPFISARVAKTCFSNRRSTNVLP